VSSTPKKCEQYPVSNSLRLLALILDISHNPFFLSTLSFLKLVLLFLLCEEEDKDILAWPLNTVVFQGCIINDTLFPIYSALMGPGHK
jgi:hypothetical protein